MVQKAGGAAVISQTQPAGHLLMVFVETVYVPKQSPYVVESRQPNRLYLSQTPQLGGDGQSGVIDGAQTDSTFPHTHPVGHDFIGDLGSIPSRKFQY